MAEGMESISLYGTYVKSESWKCSKSPINAHSWKLIGTSQHCTYCNEVRPIIVPPERDIFKNRGKRFRSNEVVDLRD